MDSNETSIAVHIGKLPTVEMRAIVNGDEEVYTYDFFDDRGRPRGMRDGI